MYLEFVRSAQVWKRPVVTRLATPASTDTEAPGFGPGQFVFLGQDNFRPDETQIDFESRVCKRFDIDKRHRLRYVEVDL